MLRTVVPLALVALVTACGGQSEEAKGILDEPADCRTAEGDLRILEKEKVHTEEQIAAGVTSIVPAGLVIGIVTGTQGEKMEVASGEYNERLEAKIAEIKATCDIS